MNAVANPVIEKQCFRNDSPGWLGVVMIGPKGDDRGRSVAHGDLVWLSEAEQILTANAPRKAEDNPFVPQMMVFGVDEEGTPIQRLVTPLTPVSENRYVPAGDRPIPAQNMQTAPDLSTPAPEAADEETDIDPDAIAKREAAIVAAKAAGQRPEPIPVPARAAAAVEAANQAKVETPPPDAPPAALSEVPEEHAAVERVPEEQAETGAAVKPSEDAPEGEYAAQEEVGTPMAPAAAPEPYTPPQEG